MKTSAAYLASILFLIGSLQVQGQELEGKWIITGNKSFGGFPGIHLMAIGNDSLAHYDFDTFFTKTSLEVEGNSFKIDTLAYATYDFKGENRLKIASDRLPEAVEYVRLVPTQTALSEEEIRQTKYHLDWRGETFEVDFMEHPDNRITHSYLEKIDATYFLVIYRHGRKMTAVPIKEVSEAEISLYGFPNEAGMLVGTAVE